MASSRDPHSANALCTATTRCFGALAYFHLYSCRCNLDNFWHSECISTLFTGPSHPQRRTYFWFPPTSCRSMFTIATNWCRACSAVTLNHLVFCTCRLLPTLSTSWQSEEDLILIVADAGWARSGIGAFLTDQRLHNLHSALYPPRLPDISHLRI